MLLRLVVLLTVFSFAFVAGVSVCLGQAPPRARAMAERKPTPTPTPPTGGPNTGNPGGAGRHIDRRGGEQAPRYMEAPSQFRRSTSPAGVGKRAGMADPSARRLRSYRLAANLLDLSVTCDPTEHEQEDLTGTYTGNIDFPSRTISGPATLNIEGHRFTLTAGDVELSGDVSSVTTCDYTAVAMRLETPNSPTNPSNGAESISLKALRKGPSLTLTSVEGQTDFKFTPTSKAIPDRRP